MEAKDIRACYASEDGFYESALPALRRTLRDVTEVRDENRTLQRAIRFDSSGKIHAAFAHIISTLQQQIEEARKTEEPLRKEAEKAFVLFKNKADAQVQKMHEEAAAKKEKSHYKKYSKKIPVPVVIENGNLICPTCQMVQRGNRKVCWKCEQIFANGQPGIPYWCDYCGRPGPYGEICPECGATGKIMNRCEGD